MHKDAEQPASAAAFGEDDLLCGSQGTVRQTPAHALVTLRVESAGATETKVRGRLGVLAASRLPARVRIFISRLCKDQAEEHSLAL